MKEEKKRRRESERGSMKRGVQEGVRNKRQGIRKGWRQKENSRLSRLTDLVLAHGFSHVGLCEKPTYLEAR